MSILTLLSSLLLFSLSTLAAYVTIPLYMDPSNWQILETAIAAYPHLTFTLIVNPDSGPGSSQFPESDYISGVARLNSYANVVTIGYVHIEYGSRDLSDVQADINKYAGWATYSGADIHLSGIFVDEAPADYSDAYHAYLTTVSNNVKSAFPAGGNHVALNPGAVADSSYYALADAICIYESSADGYSNAAIASVPSAQKAASTVIMYGFSGSQDQQAQLVNSISSTGVAGIFITASDGYTEWSDLFSQFVEAVAGTAGDAPASVAPATTTTTTTPTTQSTTSSKQPSKPSTTLSQIASSTAPAEQDPSSQTPTSTVPADAPSDPTSEPTSEPDEDEDPSSDSSSQSYPTPSSTSRHFHRPGGHRHYNHASHSSSGSR